MHSQYIQYVSKTWSPSCFSFSFKNIFMLQRHHWKGCLYAALVAISTLMGDGRDALTTADTEKSFLSDKRNFLNLIFVKWGWLWTLTLLLPYLYTIGSRRSLQNTMLAYTRCLLATVCWLLVTQWFFGHSLLARIMHLYPYAQCDDLKYSSFAQCKQAGLQWKSIDVSGHCFLLIHSSMLMLEEVSFSSHLLTTLHAERYLQLLMGALLTLWMMMLTATSFHFHTAFEKSWGVCFGLAFWLATYCSSYRWLQVMPAFTAVHRKTSSTIKRKARQTRSS